MATLPAVRTQIRVGPRHVHATIVRRGKLKLYYQTHQAVDPRAAAITGPAAFVKFVCAE